jgi:CheY-like chemotaxis protein
MRIEDNDLTITNTDREQMRCGYLAHIFDPYFTTKQKGSGLGLATAYAIVSKHSGLIAVSSQPGEGSTFEGYLPAKDAAPESGACPETQMHSGKGRILVMDDEDSIRFVIGNMLEHLGYDPLLTEDGEEAVESYRKAAAEGAPFSAVILDLTVRGGMGGRDCLRQLLELDPHVKAVVSSGYSEDPVMFDYRSYGFRGIIVKPYQIETLAEVLHRVIEGPAS